MTRRFSPDVLAVLILVLLWLLFFWRLFTPVDVDRRMLVEGDFSGQFVAFGAYQYERLSSGEIPLWNPYNNAGLPFVADTQAAVFYPPRLATIALTSLFSDWSYNTLQIEMTVHVLTYSLFMYLLVRRLTTGKTGSVFGAFISAVVLSYGGFVSGYPPLQLALLEAAIWLPLALVGIVEATRYARLHWAWLALTGLALGVSWMAGHPQTSWFATYLVVAYFAYRVYVQKYHWTAFIGGTILFGVITFGVVAVQFIPGVEYTLRSMRANLSFDQKGNGFPFQDVVQFVFPGIMSIYSPLFVGVTGITLALIAMIGKTRDYLFWGGAALFALLVSFGANSALFHALYNLLPGLNFFRGQERAAYLVANMLAILAGLGTVYLLNQPDDKRLIRRFILGLFVLCAVVTLIVFVAWFGDMEFYSYVIGPVFFSTLIVGALWLLITRILDQPKHTTLTLALVGLIVFELFTVNMDDDTIYEPARSGLLETPSLVTQIQADEDESPFRVDGNFIGITGNFASLYEVQDIRGISPLFLDGPHAIIQRELPSEVAWELFAVRYVLTGAEEIPTPAELIGQDQYTDGTIYLHRLTDPRPFATLLYEFEVLNSDVFARALLADPNYNERTSIILANAPNIDLPASAPTESESRITIFEPERVVIEVDTTQNAILSLAMVDYPGWQARIGGERVETIRAYGALTAIPISAGSHTVELVYTPWSFRVGTLLSLVTWSGLAILGVVVLFRLRKRHGHRETPPA